MHTSQRGFGFIYLILVVAVLGLVGTAFAIVTISQKERQNEVSSDTAPTPTAEPTPSTPPASPQSVDPSVLSNVTKSANSSATSGSTVAVKISNNTLPISEWGVSAYTTEDLGIVSYTYNAADNRIELNSSLQKRLPASCPYANRYGWGLQQTPASQVSASEREGKRLVNGYYYAFLVPSEQCPNDEKAMDILTANYLAIFNGLK